jgi:pimeloyl-ACP methyl ester carboxylesterase
MFTPLLLAGISQRKLQTERLEIAYLSAGQGPIPVVLVHGNCSSSLFFQDFMLALAVIGQYTIYALDMRGYGDSATLPVDATRGVRDFSDDLASFVRALQLPPFHLLGWSLGGNIVIQYVIDYPGNVRTLLLEAAGSPYGFGGSKGIEGTPTWSDYAGSGAGTVNPGFVQSLLQQDRGNGPTSPRYIMNTFYFKPPFRVAPDREEIYVSAILSTKVTPGNYPGDVLPSLNWPGCAPGMWGVNNALSPKYFNQSELVDCAVKPPVLWLHGADDQVVADTSMFDVGYLGQLGLLPGWPGVDHYPPQPMKAQMRAVLERYKGNGGEYQEVMLPECGHAAHIEKQHDVLKLCTAFMEAHS